jgi:hypothetical protein
MPKELVRDRGSHSVDHSVHDSGYGGEARGSG